MEGERIEDCSVGPVPVTGVVNILRELREQGWTTTFVAFAGMITMQGKLSIGPQMPVPSYVIIAEKMYYGDQELELPKFSMGQK